jgi:hypothetical protein
MRMPHLCCWQPAAPPYPHHTLPHSTWELNGKVASVPCLTCAAAGNQPPHCTSIPRQLSGLVWCRLQLYQYLHSTAVMSAELGSYVTSNRHCCMCQQNLACM